MKLLFIKHGEDMDDIENRLGGWHDVSLSPKGIKEAESKIPLIEKTEIDFKLIISSPFKRTLETADILRKKFNLPIIEEEYLKEVNAYGIFRGMKLPGLRFARPRVSCSRYKLRLSFVLFSLISYVLSYNSLINPYTAYKISN